MSQYIRSLPPWLAAKLPANGLFFFYDFDTDQEYRITFDQLGVGGPGAGFDTVDLLDLTTDQMREVLALAFTAGDADPAASPGWSFPGMQFDADYNGKNCHFYCTRGTFDPAAPAGTTGVGPAWHYFQKQG